MIRVFFFRKQKISALNIHILIPKRSKEGFMAKTKLLFTISINSDTIKKAIILKHKIFTESRNEVMYLFVNLTAESVFNVIYFIIFLG